MLPTLLSQEAIESCTCHKEEESQKGILDLGQRVAHSGEVENLLLKRDPRVILALESLRTAVSDEADGETWRDLSTKIRVCEYPERFVQLRQFELN